MKKVHLTQADITTFAVHAIVNSANKSLLGGNLPEFALNEMQNAGRISKVANTLKGASQAFNGSEKISALGNAVA